MWLGLEAFWKHIEMLVPIASMLVGLIRRSSSERVHEEPAEYDADNRRRADYDYEKVAPT